MRAFHKFHFFNHIFLVIPLNAFGSYTLSRSVTEALNEMLPHLENNIAKDEGRRDEIVASVDMNEAGVWCSEDALFEGLIAFGELRVKLRMSSCGNDQNSAD